MYTSVKTPSPRNYCARPRRPESRQIVAADASARRASRARVKPQVSSKTDRKTYPRSLEPDKSGDGPYATVTTALEAPLGLEEGADVEHLPEAQRDEHQSLGARPPEHAAPRGRQDRLVVLLAPPHVGLVVRERQQALVEGDPRSSDDAGVIRVLQADDPVAEQVPPGALR